MADSWYDTMSYYADYLPGVTVDQAAVDRASAPPVDSAEDEFVGPPAPESSYIEQFWDGASNFAKAAEPGISNTAGALGDAAAESSAAASKAAVDALLWGFVVPVGGTLGVAYVTRSYWLPAAKGLIKTVTSL